MLNDLCSPYSTVYAKELGIMWEWYTKSMRWVIFPYFFGYIFLKVFFPTQNYCSKAMVTVDSKATGTTNKAATTVDMATGNRTRVMQLAVITNRDTDRVSKQHRPPALRPRLGLPVDTRRAPRKAMGRRLDTARVTDSSR